MAKKKTTRKKKASAPRRNSKAKSTAAAKPKRKVAKSTRKSVSRKKTPRPSSGAKAKKAGASKKKTSGKKTSKKSTGKRSAAKTKKSSTKSGAAKPTSKKLTKKAGQASKSQPKAASKDKASKSAKAAKPTKQTRQTAAPSRPATIGPSATLGRKAGMLDPTPAHPNDAKNAQNTPARLTRKQLNHFRDLLLRRRAELIGDVQAMESGALRGGGGDDSNHAPMHMADAGSDTFDQEFALQLAATERELLDEINASLELIKEGTYGTCEVTGKPISLPRLEAKPWAKVCIEVARERDRFHRMRH